MTIIKTTELSKIYSGGNVAPTSGEAQQLSGIVVVPFLILIIVQLTGVVVFKPLYVILFGLFLFALSCLIILRIGPRFDREEILTTL